MSTNEVGESERRCYFRIDDSVVLHYSVIPVEELPARTEALKSGLPDKFTVMAGLSAIGQDMNGLLRRIKKSNPDIASYLKAMDEKLDLLGRAFFAQSENLGEEIAQTVSLSASGLGFVADDAIPVGSILETKFILFPTFSGIFTYAKVVRCELQDEGQFDIGVEFSFIEEEDREILIRHVLGRQHAALRAQA